MGWKIFRRAEKDIEKKIKTAKKIIFFLDYDGTLTPIRKKPPLARIEKDTKTLLKKLQAEPWAEVFIVSGRSLKNVKNLIGLKSLHYIGNHGMELDGPRLEYINRTAKFLAPFIQKAYRRLSKELKLKGVILENKIYTLSLHYRLVDSEKVPEAKRIFKNAISPLRKTKKILVTKGKKVLEVRPNIKWNKGKIVNWVLKRLDSKKALPVCIGDDKTDEDAFKALGKRGISILVSRKRKRTEAEYRLDSPKEVIKFLRFVLHIRRDTKS